MVAPSFHSPQQPQWGVEEHHQSKGCVNLHQFTSLLEQAHNLWRNFSLCCAHGCCSANKQTSAIAGICLSVGFAAGGPQGPSTPALFMKFYLLSLPPSSPSSTLPRLHAGTVARVCRHIARIGGLDTGSWTAPACRRCTSCRCAHKVKGVLAQECYETLHPHWLSAGTFLACTAAFGP